jgi:hypothetical protein
MLLTGMTGREPCLAVGDALRRLSAIDWTGARGRPGVIAYIPSFWGNPYQELLYSQLPSAGLQAVPMYDVDTALTFVKEVSGADLDLIVHAHWLNVVTARAKDETAARASVKAFVDRLQEIKEHGARLLWTVHNLLPHENRYPDVDLELRKTMVDVVDRIHVMSPRTRSLVAAWFELPERKTFVVPHPSYHGVYPSWMHREKARVQLGITPSTIVFLAIGAAGCVRRAQPARAWSVRAASGGTSQR